MNKKGAAMVEAAIIWPLAIGAVMAVVYIMICMYINAAIAANLHLQLREKGLQETGSGVLISEGSRFIPDDIYGWKAFHKRAGITEGAYENKAAFFGEICQSYHGSSLIRGKVYRAHQSTVYKIDERDSIRKADMIMK